MTARDQRPTLSLVNGRDMLRAQGGAATPAPVAPAAPAAELTSPLARNVETLVIDAYNAGLEHGEVQFYKRGWRFGVVCGLLPGLASGVATVVLFLWLGLL